MCSLKVPISILDQANKYRKHCLWNRGDVNRRGGCLVAWDNATWPKYQGVVLDIINLRDQNTAPLVKFLHKFYNKKDLPWVKVN
jgi:hypothetical protein